ncbi:uncharacterized protein LOC131315585 [Rhododendron vialii]|uniref:uncharacterized protein LOC131315585 n=1 Tax=Rhododendron vialii TaxID=182163 RepID=UPI00265ECB54|nr:uncharacterized protein LOC131315585 [Rhododendron vialii]XP_058200713.1 uncharacterized protein LOC131315585 [Rhododendron vialii]
MSNNLVSQPLSVPSSQMGHTLNNLEVSIPNMEMGIISSSPRSQSLKMSNQQMDFVEPMSNTYVLRNPQVLNRQIGHTEGLQQYLMPNQQVGHMEGMWNNFGSQKVLPSKRRAMGETMASNPMGQQLSMPNKNVTRMEPYTNIPGLNQPASPNKRIVSGSATPGSQNFPATNKKMARNDSISGKSGTKQLQTPKNRTTQAEPSPKAQSESFESVRSKMRDSLASALALVTQGQDKSPNEEKTSENVSENPTDSLPSKEPSSSNKINDVQVTPRGIFTTESLPNEDVSFADSFFVKDDLLQGNGLTWAWDLDVDMGERKEDEHVSKKPKLVDQDIKQEVRSPQNLAFKIEAELFKFFGGVNKKYKEKGRSLLFNLKDHNNPELRERVMSGDIPPERLCSMSAEDLASKELSQWRIAKAEELAQMVVLPDSDVDMRRLVKKTHKGEFQVEFEQDDGVSVEVSVGTSSHTSVETENKETETDNKETDELKDKETVGGEKVSSGNQDISYSLSIPSDGTDLMQGLMVDEFKDAEFLPPIVSLDEFMESLDAEPPFENLAVVDGKAILPSDKDSSEGDYKADGGKRLPQSEKESSEGGYQGIHTDVATKEPVDTTPEKSDKVEVKYADSDVKMKAKDTPIEPKPSPHGAVYKGERVWEGVLQLNVSTLVTVVGFFRSGEKISTKDWPVALEIKGRVRLDAFEKFVQGLPMSRSRAVMIVHFALKEGSSENDHAHLGEVVESYVADERLGFAEASKGVEIYFCPPHPKIVEILTKNLSKYQSENLNSTGKNGLIGMIVWRRPHLSSSAMSPNSSHHQNHTSKRQQFTPTIHQEKHTADRNVNFPSKQTLSAAPPRVAVDDGDDDDIPPGFGPARDEDDLPEFNFSNPSLPSPSNQIQSRGSNTPAPPLDQIRELIHKYGQTGNNVDSRNVGGMGNQQWNAEDDDDDIPEWQPSAPTQQKMPAHPLPVHNFQMPTPPHFGAAMAQPLPPRLQVVTPSQPPVNVVQGGARWAQPPSYDNRQHPSNLGSHQSGGGGQYYGGPPARTGHTGVDRRRGGGRRK